MLGTVTEVVLRAMFPLILTAYAKVTSLMAHNNKREAGEGREKREKRVGTERTTNLQYIISELDLNELQ